MVTPTSPAKQEGFVPKTNLMGVSVAYGSNYDKFQVPSGSTMGEILSDSSIRAQIGYGQIKNDEKVMLIANGKEVGEDYVVKENDELEILKRAGEKA